MISLSLFSIIAGHPHVESKWIHTKEPCKFRAKYGYAFEDFWSYPVVQRFNFPFLNIILIYVIGSLIMMWMMVANWIEARSML